MNCKFPVKRCTNFSLNCFNFFQPNLLQKFIYSLNEILNLPYSSQSKYRISALIDNLYCLDQVNEKTLFTDKKDGKHHHCILERLETKFYLKPTILNFYTKFEKKKGSFHSKTVKLNSTIESCIFEYIKGTKDRLKWSILNFWTKFSPKTLFGGLKQEKCTPSLNYAYSN